jgi:hypothetical protein
MLSWMAVLLLPSLARAQPVDVSIGGYVQPQVRLRQNAEGVPFDEDGFRLRRARVLLGATRPVGCVDVRVRIEGEMTPEFQLLDGYLEVVGRLSGRGAWRAAFGQVKAPFSRQTLLSDSALQLVEKAALTELAPDRQLGLTATLLVPHLPWIELSAGVFNGEGRNLVDNADESFLYAGRIALRPIGPEEPLPEEPLIESALGRDQLSIALDVFHNVRDVGDYDETTLGLGGDAFVSWNGLSATFEYLLRKTTFTEGSPRVDFDAQGINAQVGWLLPIPGALYRRLEIAARLEEIDRNDVIPIENPGDENQSLRTYTAAVSWYPRGHALKAQLNLSHVQEVEDVDRDGGDATYANDTILFQVTYRME